MVLPCLNVLIFCYTLDCMPVWVPCRDHILSAPTSKEPTKVILSSSVPFPFLFVTWSDLWFLFKHSSLFIFSMKPAHYKIGGLQSFKKTPSNPWAYMTLLSCRLYTSYEISYSNHDNDDDDKVAVMILVIQYHCTVEVEKVRDYSLDFITLLLLEVGLLTSLSLVSSFVKWNGALPLYSLLQNYGKPRCHLHPILVLDYILWVSIILWSPRSHNRIVPSMLESAVFTHLP